MGNWRTVLMEGVLPAESVDEVRRRLRCDMTVDEAEFNHWGPLAISSMGSICGLNDWPAELASRGRAHGNLFERDFGPGDVADDLRLLAGLGLRIKVHCGDDWEQTNCVATVLLDDDDVTILAPQVEDVGSFTDGDLLDRFNKALASAVREQHDA